MKSKDLITQTIFDHRFWFSVADVSSFICTAEGCGWRGKASEHPAHVADMVFKALEEAGLHG